MELQLVPLALCPLCSTVKKGTILPMAIKFVVKGIPVEADSAAEAWELIRLGNGTKPQEPSYSEPLEPPAIRHRSRLSLKSKKKNGFDIRSVTVAFLSKIVESGREGAVADNLMEIVGARHPKGIGSKSVAINEFLENLGFDPENVYDNPRTAAGRIWKPGPKLLDALEAARRA